MELAGEEKRIQALFSEASLHDRSTAPAFEKLCARVEIATSETVRFNRRLVLAIAPLVLLVAASTFAAWSWFRFIPTTQPGTRIASQPLVTPLPLPAPQLALQSKYKDVKTRPVHLKRARSPQPQRTALNEAALLSRWQSPTQLLMQFSKTVDLSSLPQLDQSVEALKQFLPANTDLKKESKQ